MFPQTFSRTSAWSRPYSFFTCEKSWIPMMVADLFDLAVLIWVVRSAIIVGYSSKMREDLSFPFLLTSFSILSVQRERTGPYTCVLEGQFPAHTIFGAFGSLISSVKS